MSISVAGVIETKRAYLEMRAACDAKLHDARQLWIEACLARLKMVTTIEEAIRAYREAPAYTIAKARALQRWVELCETTKQLHQANQAGRYTFLSHFFWDKEADEVRHPALKKWMDTKLPRIETAATLEEIKKILSERWDHYFAGTPAFNEAVARKRASLVSSKEDAELIFEDHLRYENRENRELHKRILKEKLLDLNEEIPWKLQDHPRMF